MTFIVRFKRLLRFLFNFQLFAIGSLSLCHTRDYYFDFIVFIAHFVVVVVCRCLFAYTKLSSSICDAVPLIRFAYSNRHCHIDCPRSGNIMFRQNYYAYKLYLVVVTFADGVITVFSIPVFDSRLLLFSNEIDSIRCCFIPSNHK